MQCVVTHAAPKWHCQLFDSMRTDSTVKFSRSLKERMSDRSTVLVQERANEIQLDIPLILPVQKCTRIGTDIDNATKSLNGIPPAMVAVIVVHVKDEHALPRVITKDSLVDDKYDAYGLITDMAFLNGKLYDCEMNTNGQARLTAFVQGHSKYLQQYTQGNNTVQPQSVTDDPLPSVQLVCQLEKKKAKNIEGLVNMYFPKVKRPMEDAVPKLECTIPWIIACRKDEHIHQNILKSSHVCPYPKLLLALHNNKDEDFKIYRSTKKKMLTIELHEDLAEVLRYDDNTRPFLDAISVYLKTGRSQPGNCIFL